MSEWFSLDVSGVERLQKAMLNCQGRAVETTINSILHDDGETLISEAVYRLMPRSDKKAGRHAKVSKSLTSDKENLSVTIAARGKWHYLYFPDDGTNTRRHVGNQQFFRRGAESVQDEIVDRCVNRLVNQFEEGMIDV